ncbi:hypothetical protein ABB29_05865 [Pseudoxanthomonas dokdonensis]|uniref:Uncharacterized protein n=1 Tax=Pseudoxanthomonas dokdonensis TaxID=344882 RepID=A0A0R0CWD1_9GAMM|nr:hypothetical protein ABB29_05865 [Pseudoxanthomonas dokdonensis]
MVLAWPLTLAATELQRSEGVASNADGRPLYREIHWQRGGDAGEHWVLYTCPDGAPFARKWLPAATSALARGYRLEDRRSGQQATVTVSADNVAIDWTEQRGASARQRQLPLPAQAVIDTGFDAAVRRHWSELMDGKAITLPFLVPGRQRFYPVQVQRQRALDWRGQPAQAIQVELDTWYGAVAPRLALVYADSDRRLLEFNGTSNLRDEAGDYPQVVVRFAAPPATASDQQRQRDWQRPLVAQCAASKK